MLPKKLLTPSSKRGMTIAEVLISGALLSIAIAAATKIFISSYRSMQKTEDKDQASLFNISLNRHFSKVELCTASIAGITLPAAAAPAAIDLGTNYQSFGWETGKPVKANVTFGDNLKLLYLSISEVPNAVPALTNQSKLSGQVLNLKMAKLSWQLASRGDNNTWTSLAPQNLQILVYADTANKIVYCKEDTNIAEACDIIGSKLVKDPITGKEMCTPSENCTIMGTYADVSCNPGWTCNYSLVDPTSTVSARNPGPAPNVGNPANNNLNACANGSVATPISTQTATDVVSCGKKCTATITTTAVRYLCMCCTAACKQ